MYLVEMSVETNVLFCRHVCDGQWQCPQGADEYFAPCQFRTCSGLFLCVQEGQRVCLHLGSLCDGLKDCYFGEDEFACDLPSTCPEYCSCLLYAIECDGNFATQFMHFSFFKNLVYTNFNRIPEEKSSLLVHTISFSHLIILIWTNSFLKDLCRFSQRKENRMQYVDFSSNEIHMVSKDCFRGFTNVQMVLLMKNKLKDLNVAAFTDVRQILLLNISENELVHLDLSKLENVNIHALDIRHNKIMSINFENLENSQLKALFTEDHRQCCFLETSDIICSPDPEYPLCCASRTERKLLRVTVILVGLFLFVLNGVAILLQVVAIKSRRNRKVKFSAEGNVLTTETTNISVSFILNIIFINASNTLFAIHLLLLIVAHWTFGDTHVLYSDAWLQSAYCKSLGCLAFFNIISNLFLLNLLTISRFIVTKYPFKDTLKSVSSLLKWVKLGLSVIVLFCCFDIAFYLLVERQQMMPSAICLLVGDLEDSLTIQVNSAGLSLLQTSSFVIIVVQYWVIYKEIRKPMPFQLASTKSNRETSSLVAQGLLITIFSALCWLPSAAIYLTSLCMQPFPAPVLMWNAVVICPVNSLLTPIIYVFYPSLREKAKASPKPSHGWSLARQANCTREIQELRFKV